MSTTIALTLVDGVRIVVPDSLELITPYVLREQEDWFEDEIRFVRRLLQAGDTAVDIGANYGVYALSMARAVGPRGSVFAFEPASATASLLAASIAANGFANVVLSRSAVSSTRGEGRLAVGPHAELNALVHADPGAGAVETVPLITLDDCMLAHDWRSVEFLKIDAEGEEERILQGGGRFFAERSPLVQYEVKAGDRLHLGLVQAFAALGYASYRLVPGPGVLAPFDPATADPYLLNLFCCKADRAASLAARGLLADGPNGGPAAEHCSALGERLERLKSECEVGPSPARLSALARAARDYGARSLAVTALGRLASALVRGEIVDTPQPVLAPEPRFDRLAPRGPLEEWLLAATLEALERLSAYSSFYTGTAARARLEAIRNLGYGDAEMARRLGLVHARFNVSAS